MSSVANQLQRELGLTLEPEHSVAADVSDAHGITMGLGFLRLLFDDCRMFTDYLIANYIHQHSGFGPTVPLPQLVSAPKFADAALGLFRGHLLPKTEAVGSDSDALMATMKALSSTGAATSVAGFKSASGYMAKTMEDIAEFKRGYFETGADFGVEPLAHKLLLFERILWSAILLVVAHEASHIVLGHIVDVSASTERMREDEVRADVKAAEILADVEGFDMRAIALLFAFLSDYDDGANLQERHHPFAPDRLSVLAAAVASDPGLRRDMNAAMTLVRRQQPVSLSSIFPDKAQVSCSWSFDLEATLLVELAFSEDISDQLLKGCAAETTIEIRDLIHPANVFRRARVTMPLRDGQASSVLFGKDGVMAERQRRSLTIVLPPSWWIDHPASAAAVTNIAIVPTAEEQQFSCADRLTDEELLGSFQRLASTDPVLAAVVVRAAQLSESAALAERLTCAALSAKLPLADPAMIWIGERLEQSASPDAILNVLPDAVKNSSPRLRGLQLQYAQALWKQTAPKWRWFTRDRRDTATVRRCLELAWKQAMLGAETDDGETAGKFLLKIQKAVPRDALVQTLIKATVYYHNGAQLLQAERRAEAERALLSSVSVWQAFAKENGGSVISYQHEGETWLALRLLRPEASGPASYCLREVIARDRGFVPAYTELAKLAMEDNDMPGASHWLDLAAREGASHDFLAYVRTEVLRRVGEQIERLGNIAQEAFTSGEPNAAIEAINASSAYFPLAPELLACRALLEFQAGRLDQARQSIATSLGFEDGGFEPVVTQAEILLELGQTEMADQMLTVALGFAENSATDEHEQVMEGRGIPYSLAPARSRAYAARAWARVQLGNSERARSDIESSGADRDDGRGCYYRARAYAALGKPEEAAREARAALAATYLPLFGRLHAKARELYTS